VVHGRADGERGSSAPYDAVSVEKGREAGGTQPSGGGCFDVPPAFTLISAATTRAKIDREAETFDDVMADRFA
jgi:hypothetical protein